MNHLPHTHSSLVGHQETEQEMLHLFRSGKIPHGWLITGPQGSGKATLAYRLARFLLFYGKTLPQEIISLDIPEESSVFRRVAALSHGDLFVVSRTPNKEGKLPKYISVDEARQAIRFLRKTSAEGGWRAVIIDTADDLNHNAANALLKVLEEPSPYCLIILLSSQPTALPVTLRSRCRLFPLKPLSPQECQGILEKHKITSEKAQLLTAVAQCSPGKALQLHHLGGERVYLSLLGFLEACTKKHGLRALPGLIKTMETEETAYPLWCQLLLDFPSKLIEHQLMNPALSLLPEERSLFSLMKERSLAEWMEIWAELRQFLNKAFVFNIDPRQTLEGIVYLLKGA